MCFALRKSSVYVFACVCIMSMTSPWVENNGLEPLTPCVQSRCSKPTELIPRSAALPPRYAVPHTILPQRTSRREAPLPASAPDHKDSRRADLPRRPGTSRAFLPRPPMRARLQKGGVPAAPSGTATLLRLSPSHPYCPWPALAGTAFRHPGLPWLDGRCVQGPGTYSPRHG